MGQPVTISRLLELARQHIRGLVRNGEVTERGLAKRAGVSQPYLHNVLKGERRMTPELADKLLAETGANLLALTDPAAGAQPRRLADKASR